MTKPTFFLMALRPPVAVFPAMLYAVCTQEVSSQEENCLHPWAKIRYIVWWRIFG